MKLTLQSIERFMEHARTIVITMRAGFLPASLLPITAGTLFARQLTGSVDLRLFAWTAVGVALLHISANVANDYFDYRSGNDAINTNFVRPFTGGSRTVQEGLISPGGLLTLALVCLVLSFGPALYIASHAGVSVLALGAFGAISGWLYSAPPVRLASRGWGEATIALDFGVLPVAGACLVQTGQWYWSSLWIGFPISIIIVAVVIANELPDFEADRIVGKRNWVVRLERRRASALYAMLMLMWPAALILAVWAGGAPKMILLALAGIPVAVLSARAVLGNHNAPRRMDRGCVLTVLLHAAVGMLICAGLLL